jgi:hypothetical protein
VKIGLTSADRALNIIDPATKYCLGAPSISAVFAEMGGKQCHCFLAGSIERFSNWYSLTYFIEGGFFLRKKPLSLLASVYSYWRTALEVLQNYTADLYLLASGHLLPPAVAPCKRQVIRV